MHPSSRLKHPLCVLALLCASATLAQAEPLRVFVSTPPQRHFVERVGGPHVLVDTLLEAGMGCHGIEAKPSSIRALAEARVYFLTGLPAEKTLLARARGAAPQLEKVDLRTGIPLLDAEGHQHNGHACPHCSDSDPHIWTSPRLAILQTQTIRDTLGRLAPEHRTAFETNAAAFIAELQALDAELSTLLAPVRGATFYSYHPAFAYFAADYGLTERPIEISGKEPTPAALAALIKEARSQEARVLFVQPQFSARSAKAIAEAIGGTVMPLDPLDPDYANALRRVGQTLHEALAP